MKITRHNMDIELTNTELTDAYYEQEFNFDIEDIKGVLDDISESEEGMVFGIPISKFSNDIIEKMAHEKRRYINKYNMEWEDASAKAIEGVIEENAAKLAKNKGVLIVLEGIDGSGKTTVAEYLKEQLGDKCVLTKEPKGGSIGEEINDILIKHGNDLSQKAELLLYEAARAEHVENFIKPMLEEGKVVICDRFSYSTLAYQGYGKGLDIEKIKILNDFAQDGLEPDMTLWLNVDVETAMNRCVKQDIRDNETKKFYEEVNEGFKNIIMSLSGFSVNANQSLDDLCCDVWELVYSRIVEIMG